MCSILKVIATKCNFLILSSKDTELFHIHVMVFKTLATLMTA
jgi:hypothetical protein